MYSGRSGRVLVEVDGERFVVFYGGGEWEVFIFLVVYFFYYGVVSVVGYIFWF